ncbi:zinc-binding dehydrogenase [Streptomyces leeuwenhoekii]|uniref:zinc-binding dehydrogenase n=1 Tax=Streptomyces leeuwenhoekii TaxID=1437453 RepID=UPI00370278A9
MTAFQRARVARARPAPHQRRRRELRDLLAAGVPRPAVHGAFPLKDAAAAHAAVVSRGDPGKAVLVTRAARGRHARGLLCGRRPPALTSVGRASDAGRPDVRTTTSRSLDPRPSTRTPEGQAAPCRHDRVPVRVPVSGPP